MYVSSNIRCPQANSIWCHVWSKLVGSKWKAYECECNAHRNSKLFGEYHPIDCSLSPQTNSYSNNQALESCREVAAARAVAVRARAAEARAAAANMDSMAYSWSRHIHHNNCSSWSRSLHHTGHSSCFHMSPLLHSIRQLPRRSHSWLGYSNHSFARVRAAAARAAARAAAARATAVVVRAGAARVTPGTRRHSFPNKAYRSRPRFERCHR